MVSSDRPAVPRKPVSLPFLLGLFGLSAALVLSACGQEPNRPPSAPRPTLFPRLAAPGPPCQTMEYGPFHNENITCLEMVYDHVTPPEGAPELSGLAFDRDGTLYMARTALGEIWAMRDADGDQFMDEPYRAAAGLRLPTALAFYENALYVLSPDGVTRLDPTESGQFGDPVVLVDDLGGDTGFWPGSIGIGPDERLYVSLGASCDYCDSVDHIQPGMIVSYALDGTDRRIEATGLRDPADFAWHPDTGELWVVDSGPVEPVVSLDGPPDELNRITTGADFGFPSCSGAQEPSLPDGQTCDGTEPPRATFPHQSTPGGIAFYSYDGFPFWEGDLVVALRGSWTLPEPEGYALIVVGFEGAEPDGQTSRIVPEGAIRVYAQFSLSEFSLFGRGLFPYHPADVVIDGQGWIYLSLEEGRILRLRPRPAAGGS